MEDSLLVQNDRKRLHVPTPMLLAFPGAAIAVQMGVLFYSGQTISLSGRTPLPVMWAASPFMAMPVIAAAFIVSVAFAYFFPQHAVRFVRFSTTIEICVALALCLPLPDRVLSSVFLFYIFIFLVSTAQYTSFVTFMLREETATRYVTLGLGMGFFGAAVMQNEALPVPFPVFRFLMVFSAAASCFFYHKMPAGVWPRLAAKGDGAACPRRFFILVYVLFTIGGLMSLFGSTIAETVPHGLSVFYGALAAGMALVYVIWKRFGVPVLRIGSVGVGIGALGYILALVSLSVPTFALPACIVLSVGSVVCWLTPLFTVTLAKLYPARSLTPFMVLLGLGTMQFHSILLEAFRDNTNYLYFAYLVIAVGMGVLYLVLEPYLSFTLREKTGNSEQGTGNGEEHAGERSASTAAYMPEESASIEPRQGGQRLATVLQAQAFDKLTGQELRIAELALRGYSYTEIASALKIKPDTVKTHQKNIYSKLQINSKRELFAVAEKNNRKQSSPRKP